MTINGLPLPESLLSLVKAGRWRVPDDQSALDRLFPNRGDFTLYSLDYMAVENRHWVETPPGIYLTEPDPQAPPGDIDPLRVVLIGDLGLGWDQPLVLDYRETTQDPRVLLFCPGVTPYRDRWVEVAPNLTVFGEMLGL